MITVDVPKGKYVVAVSGGVDSMVLLDVVRRLPGVELVVAHFDHGIRPDSAEDRQVVAEAAAEADLHFVFAEGKLGPGVSEAAARTARYTFLRTVMEAQQAQGIITAHHQDDVLETAVINMLRGTGRKGLSALSSGGDILRPFLAVPKSELVAYAKAHDITWREDSTNADTAYLRNYVRLVLLPRLQKADRRKLLEYIAQAAVTNPQIDQVLLAGIQGERLDRKWFVNLPHDVSADCLAVWLRSNQLRDFDRKLIDRLVVAAKVAKPGKVFDVIAGHSLRVTTDSLELLSNSSRQKR